MATFSYKAKTNTGQTVSGVLTAESQQAALRMLDDRALFPISVIEGGQASKTVLTGRKKKLKLKVLSTFYSQLADLLQAGVPVLRSIDVLARQEAHPLLSEILKEVHNDVSGGETLADAMSKHPNAFDELGVAMVRAGEQGGFLEDVLMRISIFTERRDELRNKLLGSMIYPCILLFAGATVVTFLMAFVVPKIQVFLEQVEKPWVTTLLFASCDLLRESWMYVLGGLILLIVFLVPLLRDERIKEAIDRFKLRLPVAGKIITMVAVCRFCRILGTMLHNGVPILQALKISKDSSGNQILAEQIERAAENVQRGEPLAVPLGESGLFPIDIVDMIAVAEESNNLENVLVQIADSNEARTSRQIDLGVRLLEPLLLMFMAGLVLVIAVALLVPILKMSAAAAG
ncbi:MAG: type II secretion system F family protein [Planctomycetota bacterium]|nr:MAG: type II secretion system F family protein [Planctomycetota bacterium]